MATKVMNGLDLQSQRITNLATPSSSNDAVNKTYVDNLIAGLAWKAPVRVATTTNGTLATAYANGQAIDGITLVTGDRILLKDQTTQTDNGIYVVASSGAPTRATDADSSAELLNATVYVVMGTVNADRAYTQTTNVAAGTGPVIASDNIVWAQVGGGTSYSAGNGLALASTTFSVQANGTSIDVSSSGVKIADAAGGAGLTVAAGVLAVGAGTGISVAADSVAIDTSVVARLYATNIGNASSTSIVVTHNLGTKDIQVSIRDTATDELVLADVVATSTNTATISFATAPGTNAYRAIVHG